MLRKFALKNMLCDGIVHEIVWHECMGELATAYSSCTPLSKYDDFEVYFCSELEFPVLSDDDAVGVVSAQ
jgi:hypothetical protein